MDEKTEIKLRELQLMEQSLQNISLQKQAFQHELNETDKAISELSKAKGDVYNIVGQIMLKTNKEDA